MAQQRLTSGTRGRAVPQRRSRTPLIIIALALVALVGGGIAISQLGRTTVTTTPFTPSPITYPTGTTADGYATKGSPGAPLTVIEYGDFQCPSCAAFANQAEAALDQQYVASGKIQFVYHDFPLPQHANAIMAAAAARAAGEQGKFWQMHELLFARQTAWGESRNVKPLLLSYANALGLDRAKFEATLDSPATAATLKQAQQESMDRGVQATPSFEVDGKLVGAAQLQAAIDAALKAKGQ